MNKAKMIELLESGAYFDSNASKFFHATFRKGFRTIKSSNISWWAVKREHGIFGTNRLVEENGIYRLA
jgi:hypothetical protein